MAIFFFAYDSDVLCREMVIRAHHRGIKQVNHYLFSFSSFGTKGRDCWDGNVRPIVVGLLVQHFGPI